MEGALGAYTPLTNHWILPLKLIVQYVLIEFNLNKKIKKIHIPLKLYIKFVVFIFGGSIHKFHLIYKCSFFLWRWDPSHPTWQYLIDKSEWNQFPNDLPMPTTNSYNFRTEIILPEGGGEEITEIPISDTIYKVLFCPPSYSRNNAAGTKLVPWCWLLC